MDRKGCLDKKEIKLIKPDLEMAKALQETSANKALSSRELSLRNETAAAKISLSYDAVREVLEAIALTKGFKIYNHACYGTVLTKIL